MNESVYDLIPPPEVVPERPTRHVSKFRVSSVAAPPPSYTTFPQKQPVDGSAASHFRRPGANMGKAVGPEIDPRKFLKKGEGIASVVAPMPKQKLVRKDPLVPAADKPVMGLKTEKNFVKANALEVVNMAPKNCKVEPRLEQLRPTFGRAPPYLEQVKQQLQSEKQYVETLRENRAKDEAEYMATYVRPLTDEHREVLLTQLKERWAEKNRQFQSIPFARDTMMQVARKEAVEKELREIEVAISKLEKKVVYIYKDDPTYGAWAKSAAQEEALRTALSTIKT
jgi:hypothetical protein